MRLNQVSIKIQRFGNQAPEGQKEQTIEVYADSNNIDEALLKALSLVRKELENNE